MYRTNKKGRKDITDEVFHLLKVLFYYDTSHKAARWFCECACGRLKVVEGRDLRTGKVKSCGCLTFTHKMTGTRLHRIWKDMKSRCKDETSHNYKSYKSKNITVCEEWATSFEAFRAWALSSGYEEHLTIDRIDGSEGYSPDNCRWATRKQQSNNTSTNRFITVNGETHTISEWSDITGIPSSTISKRLCKKWDEEKAITTPLNLALSSKYRKTNNI